MQVMASKEQRSVLKLPTVIVFTVCKFVDDIPDA